MAIVTKSAHEIYRSGWQMVKAHGAGAKIEALRLATGCKEQGDKAEADQWIKVASAIDEISKSIPSLSK